MGKTKSFDADNAMRVIAGFNQKDGVDVLAWVGTETMLDFALYLKAKGEEMVQCRNLHGSDHVSDALWEQWQAAQRGVEFVASLIASLIEEDQLGAALSKGQRWGQAQLMVDSLANALGINLSKVEKTDG